MRCNFYVFCVLKNGYFYNLMIYMNFIVYFSHFCKLIIYLSTNFMYNLMLKNSCLISENVNVKIILPIDRKNGILVEPKFKKVFSMFSLFSCNEMKNPLSKQ